MLLYLRRQNAAISKEDPRQTWSASQQIPRTQCSIRRNSRISREQFVDRSVFQRILSTTYPKISGVLMRYFSRNRTHENICHPCPFTGKASLTISAKLEKFREN